MLRPATTTSQAATSCRSADRGLGDRLAGALRQRLL